MNTFFHFVLVTGATLGFCYGLYLLFLEIATRYGPCDEDSGEDPNDFC